MQKTLTNLIHDVERQMKASCLARHGIDPDFWPILTHACPRCSGTCEDCIVDLLRGEMGSGTPAG